MSACDECLTRRWLLDRLSPYLSRVRASVDELLLLEESQLIAAVGGRHAGSLEDELTALSQDDLEAIRRSEAGRGLESTCSHRPGYPDSLSELPAPPAVLSVNGGLDRFEVTCASEVVAIVGTRRATGYGTDAAREMARGLAAAGVTIVSGMAYGIDSAAHTGALDVGGQTIAVLAGHAAEPSPRRRAELFDRIRATGVVLSERGPDAKSLAWALQARNRIIAGLAQVTVFIEGPERSGALITVRHADTLGRPIGALPGPVGAPQSAGPNLLLAKHRAGRHSVSTSDITAVRGAQDVLDLLYGEGIVELSQTELRPPLTPTEAALLSRVQNGTSNVSMLDPVDISALSGLELKGYVRQSAGGVLGIRAN